MIMSLHIPIAVYSIRRSYPSRLSYTGYLIGYTTSQIPIAVYTPLSMVSHWSHELTRTLPPAIDFQSAQTGLAALPGLPRLACCAIRRLEPSPPRLAAAAAVASAGP